MKSQQSGFAHAFLIIALVVALIGALGFIFWQNFIYKEPVVTKTEIIKKSKTADKTKALEPEYTLEEAINDIEVVIASQGCSGAGAEAPELRFEQVSNQGAFEYSGGKSFINKGLTHAYVQYGCGSQGSVALLRNLDNGWKLVSDDARIYPMCSKVRGQEFPVTIVDKCYSSNESTDPEEI